MTSTGFPENNRIYLLRKTPQINYEFQSYRIYMFSIINKYRYGYLQFVLALMLFDVIYNIQCRPSNSVRSLIILKPQVIEGTVTVWNKIFGNKCRCAYSCHL